MINEEDLRKEMYVVTQAMQDPRVSLGSHMMSRKNKVFNEALAGLFSHAKVLLLQCVRDGIYSSLMLLCRRVVSVCLGQL